MPFDPIEMVDKLSPGLQRAFLDSVYQIRSSVNLEALTAAIQARDTSGVIRMLNLGPEFFGELDEAFRAAYRTSGSAFMASLSLRDPINGGPAVAMFNMRNPAAENWVATTSSQLIVEITQDTRKAAMQFLTQAYQQGIGPRTAALDLVGRYDKVAGRRVGGIIGLTSKEETYVSNALSELRSGDPAQMRNYFTRRARDRRFDSIVRKAIAEGKAVQAEAARKITSRYSDGLLKVRGDRVARTEMLQAAHHAQDQALEQLFKDGKLDRSQVDSVWDAANDADTRDSHSAMDGQHPDETGLFTTGAGFKLKFPGDRSHGAPAQEIVNCRCRVIKNIDFLAELASGYL